MNVRQVKSSSPPRFIRTNPSFSNFDFRDTHYPGCRPLARILSQARSLKFKTIIIESIPSVGFSKSDDLEIKQAIPEFSGSRLERLSFFKKTIRGEKELGKTAASDFLGYAILKGNKIGEDTGWIIFESVMCSGEKGSSYVHSRKWYSVRVGSKEFRTKGTLYCQQNDLTNVCAHVALRTLISCLNNRGDISYREINRILQKHSPSYKPGDKLSDEQIKVVFQAKKINFYEKKQPQGTFVAVPYHKYIYGSIESGYPALLGFKYSDGGEDKQHIIPIVGHTFNEDTWVPDADVSYFSIGRNAKYIPSETWVSSYICHDDNFGSNFCIPWAYDIVPDKWVIGALPSFCKCDPIQAEAIGFKYVQTVVPTLQDVKIPWLQRVKRLLANSRIVLRPVLISIEKYLAHLGKIRGWDKKEKIDRRTIEILSKRLRGHCWVIEVSLPQLYSANQRKVGEVILRCDADPEKGVDDSFFLMARFPGWLVIPEKSAEGKFDFARFPTALITHSPLIQLPN